MGPRCDGAKTAANTTDLPVAEYGPGMLCAGVRSSRYGLSRQRVRDSTSAAGYVYLAMEGRRPGSRAFAATVGPTAGRDRDNKTSGSGTGGDPRTTWARYNQDHYGNSTLGDGAQIRPYQGGNNVRKARSTLGNPPASARAALGGPPILSSRAAVHPNRLPIQGSREMSSLPLKAAPSASIGRARDGVSAGPPTIRPAAPGPVVEVLRLGAPPGRRPVQRPGPAKASNGPLVPESIVPRILPTPGSGIPARRRQITASAPKVIQAGRATKPPTSKASLTQGAAANARMRRMVAAA